MSKVHDTLARHILANPKAPVIDMRRSHDSWIVDWEGNKYLDCFSQYASQPLGWNNHHVQTKLPRLFAVAQHNPANSDFYTPDYAEFVEAFGRFTPDFRHKFFVSGGTLGVENALKAAFDWKSQKLGLKDCETWKLDVIHFKQAFHGRSGYTLSLTNTDPTKTDLYPKFRWSRVDNPKIGPPDVDDRTEAALTHVEDILRGKRFTQKGHTAAIIVETIQGEGGDNHFLPEFFWELRHLCDKYDAMFILDEVQCGMGLTGKTWAYEHFDAKPDVICFGKKTQVCGFAATERIDEVKDNVFTVPSRICSTWGGNLVDMVRSTIFMEVIEERKLIDNAAKVGWFFQCELANLGLKNLRGRGLMIAFDLPDAEQRDAFLERLGRKMLAIKCGERSVRFRPHLTFTYDDARDACDFVKEAL